MRRELMNLTGCYSSAALCQRCPTDRGPHLML